jgi:cyanophycin synthetase
MTNKTIEITQVISLRGPNIWTYRPALEAWVDIHDLEDSPSNTLPGFAERLLAWLPSLIEHRCGVGERGGFMHRVHEGTWAGHILEHVTLELQNLAGMQSGFGKARQTSKRGVYKVVVRAREETVSRACLAAARDLLMAAIHDQPFDVVATVARLHAMADAHCLGPSTACIVNAASERGIPSLRLSEGNLVQLGHGVRSRRIWTAETDATSAVAEGISADKDLTKRLLESCGVPVPAGRIVNNAADAWDAAEDIGTPVVVKPLDGNHGRGVSLELDTREQVEAAFALAARHGSEVIVERFVRGAEHRLLIVGGKLAAAARGAVANVLGDGKSTVAQLTERQINNDPRRGTTEDFPLNRINPHDDTAVVLELQRQGLTPDAVPAKGRTVLVQRNGNVSIDVTDQIHPDVAAAAGLAARIVGLDIAGVDLVAEDVSRPLAEQGGAIVEINAGPGLLAHLKPAEGEPRPVGRAIVDHLFASHDDGRIPIVGITGCKGKTTVARLVARMLKLSGKHVGLACGDGLFFNRRAAQRGNCATWAAGQRVLMTRSVEAAVFESSARAILTEGLAYDKCSVGVVTNIDPAALDPEFFVDTPEQLVNVFRTQVDVVLPAGVAVLNARDPLVAALASLCDGEVIWFGVAPGATDRVASQSRTVFVQDRHVVIASGADQIRLSELSAIPIVRAAPEFQTENLLAAVAAAWALGISHELIRAVIQSFTPGQDENEPTLVNLKKPRRSAHG